MYKKITHTIVEKHYSLPKMAKTKQKFNPYYDDDFRLTAALTTANKFKSDVNSYFTTMHQQLDGIITATESGNMDDLLTQETAFFDDVGNLGQILRPYYGIEFSERLGQAFRAIGLSMVGIGRSLKFKNDFKFIIDRLDPNFEGIDLLLNQYNNIWTPGVAKSTWIEIRELLVNEATAIINRDNTASVLAHTKAAEKLSTFATDLANSVIQQYPDKFIQ